MIRQLGTLVRVVQAVLDLGMKTRKKKALNPRSKTSQQHNLLKFFMQLLQHRG